MKKKKGKTMGETCREKYLHEYIADLEIDENVKKRMLVLCEMESRKLTDADKYLNNCHMRIRELEQTIVELSTELGRAKCFIREHN